MAITNYNSLYSGILSWLNRQNFPDLEAEVDTFMQLAQNRINRDLRTRHYRKQQAVTFDNQTTTVDTSPDVAGEIQSLYVEGPGGNKELGPVSLPVISELKANAGVPRYFTVLNQSGSTIELALAPEPRDTMSGTLHYYVNDPALSDTNSTNITVTEHPSLILNACLLEACIFLKDDNRVRVYEGRYQQLLNDIRLDDEKFGRPSGSGRTINLHMENVFGGFLP